VLSVNTRERFSGAMHRTLRGSKHETCARGGGYPKSETRNKPVLSAAEGFKFSKTKNSQNEKPHGLEAHATTG
jgi:hypothetical protein